MFIDGIDGIDSFVLLCCSGIVRIGNEDLVPHYICTSVPGTRGRQHLHFIDVFMFFMFGGGLSGSESSNSVIQ